MRSLPSPSLLRPAGGPRSILKRPAALPLSPGAFPYQASFSILVSQSPGSPHVHFPNTASLTSTFATFSPTSYDRAAIVVSPNPLALPAANDRVFSPTSGVFKSVAERSLDEAVMAQVNSPSVTVTDFGLDAIAKPEAAKSQSRASLRFQEKVKQRPAAPLPRDVVDAETLARFPRSPYPSAPMSPMTEAVRQSAERPVLARVKAVDARNILSPVEESPETKLSQAFWKSVTLSETPTSAVPTFVFGTRDGALWSPGLPRSFEGIQSPLSRTTFGPDVTTFRPAVAFGAPAPDVKTLKSPAVNDPFSSFPSFSAVLSMGGDKVTVPRRAVMEA